MPVTVVNGFIMDARTKLAIPATIQLVVNATLEPVTEQFFVEDGHYQAWTDRPTMMYGVLFRADGYIDKKVQFSLLEKDPDVYLAKAGSASPESLALLAIPALYLVAKSSEKKKKVGEITTGNIITAGLLVAGVVGFGLVKKMFEGLGIWDAPETKALDGLSSNPNSWWNPNFWQRKPANIPWTYTIDTATATQYAIEIYDSFGAFNDDEEQAIGVFKKCRTQANASFIAYNFQQHYGKDLLTFLRGGTWPQDRLSDADVYTINNFVDRLPKY